ncbi:MAG: tetratricopeptide repeat protein [Candidatus Omnitrophota bacterium]|nr:tetratricopeptide repeat protein [Candidatus Omnitrophota bacterium]
MKNKLFVIACMSLFFIAAVFICSVSAVQNSEHNKVSNSEVRVYLKSGEIIAGSVESKTDKEIFINKYGQSLPINLNDILRIEPTAAGNNIPLAGRLPFSTAIITYDCKGLTTGKEIVYIDAVNNKIVRENSSKLGEGTFIINENSRTIYDGSNIYDVDMDNKVATVSTSKGDIIMNMFGEQKYFGTQSSQVYFLGKECKKYENDRSSAVFWNGILLKEQIKHLMGEKYNSTKEAIDIKLETPILQEKFSVPAGITVKTLEEEMKERSAQLEKMQEHTEKQYKEFLSSAAEENPEMKTLLQQSTKKDGSLDFKKIQQFMAGREEKDIIARAKKLKDGENFIKEATSADGKLDIYKLESLMHEQEMEMWKNEGEINKKLRYADEKYRALEKVANIYHEQGKIDEAINNYKEAIKLKPDEEWAYTQLFFIYTGKGEDEKALEDISAAIEKTKDPIRCLKYRANLYIYLGRYREAINDCSRAISLALKELPKQIDEAKELFKKIGEEKNIELPSKEKALAQVYADRGEAYRRKGDYKEALDDFNDALSGADTQSLKGRVYFLRGLTYKRLNEPAKMADDWKNAEALGVKLVEVLANPRYKMEGKAIWYYSNGNMQTEGNYVNGKENGFFKWYYPSGAVKAEGGYLDGKYSGEWKWYNEGGAVTKKEKYNQGVRQAE